MKNLLIFGVFAALAATLVWWISSASGDTVDFGQSTVELEFSSRQDFSDETQRRMKSCLSAPFDGREFGNALALIQSDWNSTSSLSEKEKVQAKKESFIAEMGVKLQEEFKQWLKRANTSEGRTWRQKTSLYLEHAPNQTAMVRLQRQCSQIIWMVDNSRSSAAMDERRRLLSSKYDKEEIGGFLSKSEAISNAFPAKRELLAFASESEALFEEFKRFDDEWMRAFGRYVSTRGKDPADWIRTPSRYLEESEIRRYPWYSEAWIEEFGEIDLKY